MKKKIFILLKYTEKFIRFTGRRLILLVFYSIITGVTQGVGIFMLIPFINAVGSKEMLNNPKLGKIPELTLNLFSLLGIPLTLLNVLILFLIILSLAKYISYKQDNLICYIRTNFISNIQSQLFGKVIFAEWQYIAAERASNLTHIITTDIPTISNGTFFFIRIITGVTLSLVYIIWAMSISVELTIVALILIFISFIFIKISLPYSEQKGTIVRDARSQIYSMLLDHVTGIKTAKAYCLEHRELQKFKEISNNIAKGEQKIVKYCSKMKFFYTFVCSILICLFVYLSITLLKIPLVSLFLLVIMFSRLLPNICSLQSNSQHLFSMLPSFSAATELHINAAKHQERLGQESTKIISPLCHSIEFKNVKFGYSSNKPEPKVFNINIKIKAGNTVLVFGKSGIGKSTLADLLTGILKPISGEVLIDGTPLNNDNISSWRMQIGYLPQEIFLFHNTIRNNILWGNPNASENEIYDALKLVSAYDLVKSLPEGLDTIVKDQGQRLSGGERQRIALARTIIRKPNLLLLDEATCAVDEESEKIILEAIKKLKNGLTIIIITHRTSTLPFADQVINLK
ncbi:MAG: ABC transporter ATP-binding protein [Lentisphaerae bacterium]|nr:ABC transporter ATP-binding protein [Lentisphaerota bacterium]